MKSLRNGITFTLTILLGLPLTIFSATPPPTRQVRKVGKTAKPKLAPDLARLLAQDDKEEALRLQGKTLAEIRRLRLQRHAGAAGQATESVTARIRVNGIALPSEEIAPEEK